MQDKPNQKDLIVKYLEFLGDWEYEYKIRSINTPFGFIGARGDRNVRELIAAGKVEKDMKDGFRVVRAIAPKKEREEVTPYSVLPQYKVERVGIGNEPIRK